MTEFMHEVVVIWSIIVSLVCCVRMNIGNGRFACRDELVRLSGLNVPKTASPHAK